jgi:hypothetical protein
MPIGGLAHVIAAFRSRNGIVENQRVAFHANFGVVLSVPLIRGLWIRFGAAQDLLRNVPFHNAQNGH